MELCDVIDLVRLVLPSDKDKHYLLQHAHENNTHLLELSIGIYCPHLWIPSITLPCTNPATHDMIISKGEKRIELLPCICKKQDRASKKEILSKAS